ncbi:hypothetical protein TRFO_33157 [Tritrichomonas foetus]|uniref:Uncharacterized protein n=1 Tax=Tritrichomonas foetus TaxID=1144522 RepID=A0A1J4JP61_9EUKA|nr:hypothetical protein TRFO_33157 [Tritrichomonas foetus]|eukprot:OHT00208.1 hypothetical protein TRFO_33157 [Tritrichomonas foetus]
MVKIWLIFKFNFLSASSISFKNKYHQISTNTNQSPSFFSSSCSAFQWWNGLLKLFDQDSQKIPEKPDLDLSILIMHQISHYFTLFISDCMSNSNEYWYRIYFLINQMDLKIPLVNPNMDFPGFVKSLYSIQDIVNPKSVDGIIRIISLHPQRSNMVFLMWLLPVNIDNHYLYFTFLYEIYKRNHPIWTEFVHIPGSINYFFDHYLPLVAPSKAKETIILISLIEGIFLDAFDFITCPKKQSKYFWKQLLKIIGDKNLSLKAPDVVTVAFLAAKSIYNLMIPKLAKQYRIDWINQLFEVSKNPCVVHNQVLKLIFELNIPKYRYMTLCKDLTKQGISSVSDLEWIIKAMMMPNIKKPYFGIKFLFVLAACDKLWSSTATNLLVEPLIKYKNLDPLNVWVTIFIRRAFIFIAVTIIRKQYTRRRMMIVHLFEVLYQIGIDWINSTIEKYYSTLLISRKVQNFLPMVPITMKTDKPFVLEIDRIARMSIEMKNYLHSTNTDAREGSVRENNAKCSPSMISQAKRNANPGIKVTIPKMKGKIIPVPSAASIRPPVRPPSKPRNQQDRPLSSRAINKCIFVSRV